MEVGTIHLLRETAVEFFWHSGGLITHIEHRLWLRPWCYQVALSSVRTAGGLPGRHSPCLKTMLGLSWHIPDCPSLVHGESHTEFECTLSRYVLGYAHMALGKVSCQEKMLVPGATELHWISMAEALRKTPLRGSGLSAKVFLQSHRHILPEHLAPRILYQLIKHSAKWYCLEAP